MPHKRTQKKHKKSHRGGRIHGMNFVPGRVYYFDENNTNELDGLMQSNVPMMIRHHSKDCTYCKKFEEPWSQIEDVTKKYPQSYSVASMDPYATEKCMKKYRDYPRINGVPAVILVNQDGVPIEHTGPNTFEGLQAFLEKNGLEIVKKTEDNNTYSDAGLGTSASAESIGAAGLGAGAAGLGAAGLGAGLSTAESIGTSDSTSTAESIGTSDSASTAESNSAESNSVESIGAAEPKSVLSNVKETVSNIDDGIKQGISKLTEPIDFKNLFGFKSDTENAADKASVNNNASASNNAVANDVANANAFPEMPDELKDEQPQQQPQGNQQQQPPQQPQGNQPPPPQLPSVGGKSKKNKNKTKKGKKSRRKTKPRQHRSRK